jgi:hypothetical protein
VSTRLEDYALIGDGETAALDGRRTSVGGLRRRSLSKTILLDANEFARASSVLDHMERDDPMGKAPLFLCLFALATVSQARAATVVTGSLPGLSNWYAAGSAAPARTSDGHVLRLVNGQNNEASAALLRAPITFTPGGFLATFQFRITNPSISPADGFTFVLSAPGTASGLGREQGGYLGYLGVQRTVAVEFDTFQNGTDPGSNQVGIDVNGDIDTLDHPANSWSFPYAVSDCGSSADLSPGCLSDGDLWTATVAYDGTAISVTVQDGSSAPDEVVSNYVINIPQTLRSRTALVGFTAGTGGSYETIDIISFSFTTN